MAAHPFAVLPQRTRDMSYLESPICIPAPVAFLYAKQGPKQLPSSMKPLVWITDLTSNYTSIYPQSVVRQSPPLHLSESLFIHSLQYSAYIHDKASTLTNQEWTIHLSQSSPWALGPYSRSSMGKSEGHMGPCDFCTAKKMRQPSKELRGGRLK